MHLTSVFDTETLDQQPWMGHLLMPPDLMPPERTAHPLIADDLIIGRGDPPLPSAPLALGLVQGINRRQTLSAPPSGS